MFQRVMSSSVKNVGVGGLDSECHGLPSLVMTLSSVIRRRHYYAQWSVTVPSLDNNYSSVRTLQFRDYVFFFVIVDKRFDRFH